MPNGHTGGFEIDTAELKRLIMSTPQADVAASLFTGRSPLTPVTATELGRLLEQCQQDRVYIEDQDYTHYIVHLSDDPVIWIMVRPDSVLRLPLLARHTQQRVAAQQMLAAKTPSVPPQPGCLEATSRSAVLVIAMPAAAVFVLLGWLLFWLGVFQHLPAR